VQEVEWDDVKYSRKHGMVTPAPAPSSPPDAYVVTSNPQQVSARDTVRHCRCLHFPSIPNCVPRQVNTPDGQPLDPRHGGKPAAMPGKQALDAVLKTVGPAASLVP